MCKKQKQKIKLLLSPPPILFLYQYNAYKLVTVFPPFFIQAIIKCKIGTSFLPDMNGSVGQDLSVAGPAALTGSMVTGRLVGARGREARRLLLARFICRGGAPDQRLEMKLPHALDLHKRVVELGDEKVDGVRWKGGGWVGGNRCTHRCWRGPNISAADDNRGRQWMIVN